LDAVTPVGMDAFRTGGRTTETVRKTLAQTIHPWLDPIPNKRKRLPGNRAASSSRENSFDGGKAIETFWANLMGGKKRCQGEILHAANSFISMVYRSITRLHA
jgi:hypothetical protein